MRISCSDEEDFPGQFDLWHANCYRSIRGRKGQEMLRELEKALLALPERRLITDEIIDADGEVCALGALAKYQDAPIHEYDDAVKDDAWDMETVGVELGMPQLVAWKVVYLNDYQLDSCTPEQRYERVLSQVRKWLKPEGATQ